MRINIAAGDIGDANAQVAVARALQKVGHEIRCFADPQGLATRAFSDSSDLGNYRKSFAAEDLQWADGCVVSTDATAFRLSRSLANATHDLGKPVVFATNGSYVNHCFPQWHRVEYGAWLVIDGMHESDVRCLRPDARTYIVGHPLFEDLHSLIPERSAIRHEVRERLLLRCEKLVVWWSSGIPGVIGEDTLMVAAGLSDFSKVSNEKLVLVPRLHPKLEKLKIGYGKSIVDAIRRLTRDSSLDIRQADEIEPTHLDLAADVVVSSTSIEADKTIWIGGCPVVRPIGPESESVWKQMLGGVRLPSHLSHRCLIVESYAEMGEALATALRSDTASTLYCGWSPPEPALEVIRSTIESIFAP